MQPPSQNQRTAYPLFWLGVLMVLFWAGGGIQSPQDYVIESSTDNINWTTRSTVTGGVRDQNNDITHDFDTKNASARYWRLYCTNGHGENRIGLEKLEWYGY